MIRFYARKKKFFIHKRKTRFVLKKKSFFTRKKIYNNFMAKRFFFLKNSSYFAKKTDIFWQKSHHFRGEKNLIRTTKNTPFF